MRTIAVSALIVVAASLAVLTRAQRESSDPFTLREEPFLAQDSRLGFFSTDIAVAIGIRHFVVARNSAITLFEKSDADSRRKLGEVSMNTFFAPASHPGDRLSDPIALYDTDTGRFFIGNAAFNDCTTVDTCDGGMQLAVSKTSTPETLTDADWYFFRFDRALQRVNGGERHVFSHGDFDKLAVIGDRLLVGWQEAPTAGNNQTSSLVRVFDVRPLLEGRDPGTWRDLLYEGNTRLRIATITDSRDRATDRAFFDLRSTCTTAGMQWTIGAVVDISSNPRLDIHDAVVNTPCHPSRSVPAPQSGSQRAIFIQHLSAQPAYRDGRLWVFESDGRDARDSTSEIVWAELDVHEWPAVRVLQSGRVSGGASSAYTPAAALDSAGNLAMVFSQSGPGEFVSLYYTGRLATDPPNAMRATRALKPGTRVFNWPELNPGQPMSFVDYPAASVDPVDGSLWMAGLLPTAEAPAPGRSEVSDVWIGRLSPLR